MRPLTELCRENVEKVSGRLRPGVYTLPRSARSVEERRGEEWRQHADEPTLSDKIEAVKAFVSAPVVTA